MHSRLSRSLDRIREGRHIPGPLPFDRLLQIGEVADVRSAKDAHLTAQHAVIGRGMLSPAFPFDRKSTGRFA